MEITNNGILMTSDYQGRSSGEAYVQFSSKNDAERALEKNKQCIGHRLVWLGMGPGYLLGPTTYIDPFRGRLEKYILTYTTDRSRGQLPNCVCKMIMTHPQPLI